MENSSRATGSSSIAADGRAPSGPSSTNKEIIEGPVVSEVDVKTPAGLIVTSVITTRSVHELGLKVGKDVVALVKSTEVSIATL